MAEEDVVQTSVFWNFFETFIGDIFRQASTGFSDAQGLWGEGARVIWNNTVTPFYEAVKDKDKEGKDALDAVLKAIFENLGTPAPVAERIIAATNNIFPTTFPFQTITAVLFNLVAAGHLLTSMSTAYHPFIERAFNKQFTPLWPDLQSYILAKRRQGVENIAGILPDEFGYGSDQKELLDMASRNWLSEAHIAEAFHRGIITEQSAKDRLIKLGYAETGFRDLITEIMKPLLGIGQVVQGEVRGKIDPATAIGLIRKHGLDQGQAELTLATARGPLTPYEISKARFRGNMTLPEAQKAVAENGLSPENAALFLELQKLLPTPTDLVRFGVREVFTPEIAERFGQYEDYPTNMTPWGEKIGYSEDVLKMFWAAHWGLPAPGQGFDMYHRGIIDRDGLKLLLRALDVMPYWRDRMIQLSDRLIPRRTLPKIIREGLITEEELVPRFFALGYSQGDSELLAEYAKRAAADEPRELSKREILKAYEEGFVSEAFAREKLTDLLFPDDLVEWYIRRSQTKKELLALEAAQGATVKEVEAGQKQAANAAIDMFEEGMIDEATLAVTITNLGFPVVIANYWIARARSNAEIRRLRAQAKVVHQKLISGVIDRGAAVAALAALGFSPAGAANNVDVWIAEIEADTINMQWSERLPTKTDIIRWLKKGIIDAQTAVTWLQRLKYPDETITNYLLELITQ